MRKVMILIMVALLVFVLSGCTEDYYYKSEVDSLLTELELDLRYDLMEYYIQSYDGKLYNNCRIEDSIKVCDEIILARIDEISCDMIMMARDLLMVFNQGYTFEIDQYGMMHELKDGVYTDDVFTNNDFLEEYCNIE